MNASLPTDSNPGASRCWCGGEVGPRDPGDLQGVGCLENIHHDWAITACAQQDTSGQGAGCVLPAHHADHAHYDGNAAWVSPDAALGAS